MPQRSATTYHINHDSSTYGSIDESLLTSSSSKRNSFRHKHPANIILLGLWTVIEAYTLGVVCASLQTSGAGEIVWQAFVITSAIFIGLTLFTLVSKADFSWLGAVVFAGLIGLIAWGLISWVRKEESVWMACLYVAARC